MEAESVNCHGRELLSLSRDSSNQPKRKRDMSTVYPVDEEELLLAAADKYLQDDSSGRDSPVSIMASDDSMRSSRSFSPGSSASGSASPLPPLASASASPAPSSSWRGSPWPSPTPSPSPPLSEPESAYFGDDSDTSRPRDGGDLTEDEGGRFSSGSTSSSSGGGGVGAGGGDAPARRSRSRTVRSACFVASAIKAAPDGDDHNYSLASRCAASAASGRRRNPWRAAREGGGGGGGGGGQRRWRRWAAPSPRPPRGALLG